MRKAWIISALVVFAAVTAWAGQPQWYPVVRGGSAMEPPCVTTSTRGTDAMAFDVDVTGLLAADGITKGGTFRQLALPGETTTGDVGEAQLPLIRRLVEIPYGAELKVVLEGESSVECALSDFDARGELFPVQESILKTPDGYEKWPFRRDSKFYGTDEFLPESPVRIGRVAFYRGHRVAQVDILPVTYNPKQGLVRVYTHLHFELRMEGGDLEATREAVRRTWSEAFESEYATTFINYGMFDDPSKEPEIMTGHWSGLLIISHPAFYSAADQFAQWRRKMGYKVVHVDTGASGTNGTTAAAVKAYIQNAYNTWSNPSLGFVMLVGDTAQIASPEGPNCSCASDSDYACVSGSDNIHDLFIGRVSVETAAQATEVFARFITYSKATFTQTPWIKKACFSNSCDSTINTYNTHQYCQLTYTKPGGYTGEFYPAGADPGGDLIRCIEDYGGSGTASGAKVVEAMNHGRSMIVYSGHGGYTSWAGPEVEIGDLAAATCGEMAPFMVGHCCIAHNIDYSSPCFGESALREVAIGYWGSSESSYWGEDDYIQRKWFEKIFVGGQHRLGEFLYNTMADFYNNYSTTRGDYYMDMCLLDGDPTMELYTEVPAALAVTHDAALMVGQSSFTVTVNKAGAPLANARVCLTKSDNGDAIHEFALTNASGQAIVGFAPVPGGVGVLNVTVTAVNCKPYEGTANVVVPNGPYLSYQSHVVQDGGDGIVNPGETVILPVTVRNIGAEAGTGLQGTLTTTDAFVTMVDAADTFPDLAKDASGQTNTNHFTFSVASGCPNGHVIPFALAWADGSGHTGTTNFSVGTCAPLAISNVQFTGVTGNSATVTWTTNVPATSRVDYGPVTPPASSKEDPALVTSHSVLLTGLSSCTRYLFSVTSQSPACYTQQDTNGGAYHTFRTVTNVVPTYNYTGAPVAIPDNTTVTAVISVPDAKVIQDVNVTIGSLTHTYDGDLDIFLISPGGTRVELTTDNGSSGENFTSTVFDDEATNLVTAGTAPFTGSFKPEGLLSALDGVIASGNWTLEVTDDAGSDTGTLTSWSITFTFPSETCVPDETAGTPGTHAKWTSGLKECLEWGANPDAAHYHLFRGALGDLGNLLNTNTDACFRQDNLGSTACANLTEVPAPGAFFWYLITAVNATGAEGSAGNATSGPRQIESTGACPP